MHIAQIDFWSRIGPITRVYQLKTHLFHILSDFLIRHMCTANKRLLHNNFEFSPFISPKSQHF